MSEWDFKKELTSLLNKHSKENGSDTPDFILAEYLMLCLQSFNYTLQEREQWYGRKIGSAFIAELDKETEK